MLTTGTRPLLERFNVSATSHLWLRSACQKGKTFYNPRKGSSSSRVRNQPVGCPFLAIPPLVHCPHRRKGDIAHESFCRGNPLKPVAFRTSRPILRKRPGHCGS